MNDPLKMREHVGEMLSGFVDNELTQQDSQRVQVHINQCTQCTDELNDIRTLRNRIGTARLSDVQQDTWRETMNDITVKTSRGIGWLLVIGGVLLAGSVALIKGFADFSSLGTMEKLVVGGVYGGLLLLFVSVLRQRLIERKKDRYKDVEI